MLLECSKPSDSPNTLNQTLRDRWFFPFKWSCNSQWNSLLWQHVQMCSEVCTHGIIEGLQWSFFPQKSDGCDYWYGLSVIYNKEKPSNSKLPLQSSPLAVTQPWQSAVICTDSAAAPPALFDLRHSKHSAEHLMWISCVHLMCFLTDIFRKTVHNSSYFITDCHHNNPSQHRQTDRGLKEF